MKPAMENLGGAESHAISDIVLGAPYEAEPSVSVPPAAAHSVAPRSSLRTRGEGSFWAQLRVRSVLLVVSVLLLVFVGACASVPTWIAPSLPTDMDTSAILTAPGWAHLFGTDQFGRDVFTLVVYGARQSVLIGLFAVSISCTVGISIGLTAGYMGGWIDTALMRFIDIWMAIPSMLLALALSAALGPSLPNTILAVSVATTPRYARILRGQALSLRNRPFVEAARAAGASHWAILRGHILPHCTSQILVLATLGIGTSILIGASLSFLGLGVNDERPDWGFLLTQGRSYLTVAWWIVTYPGLAITSLVVSVNLLGDALRRHLEPRSAAR